MANQVKILVAYDGSQCADAALDDLRRAGLPSDAPLVATPVCGLRNFGHPRFAGARHDAQRALFISSVSEFQLGARLCFLK